MKFKTLDGGTVRVALLSGHVALITGEFAELEERFHADAYAQMCISEDMLKSQVASLPTSQAEAIVRVSTVNERIYTAIEEMVEANELESFSKATGAPDARIISKMIGERVSSGQRDEQWYRYQEATKA